MFYNFNAFKGLNEAVDETLLKNEATTLINATVRDGSLQVCRLPLQVSGGTTLEGIKSLMILYTNEQQILLGATTTDIYKWSGTSWDKIMSGFSSGDFSYVNDNVYGKDVVIFSNGVDNVKIWDGTGVRNVKKLGKDSAIADDNVAPKGKYLTVMNERLIICDSQNVYFSSVTADGGIDVDDYSCPTSPPEEVNQHGGQVFMYSADGTEIKALACIYGDIIIFKERKVYRIWGDTPANFQKIEMFNSSGAIANKSVVSTPSGCYFINTDGIYLYNGSSCQKISQKVQATFNTIDQAHISEAIAYYWDNRYILSCRRYGASSNDLIIELDTLTGEFTTRTDINAVSFVEFAKELLFADSQGRLFRYDRGDYSALIWESGVFTLPEGALDIEQVKVHADGTGQVRVSVETENKLKQKTVNFSGEQVRILQMACSGRTVKFKIETLSGNIKIKKLYCEYTVDAD